MSLGWNSCWSAGGNPDAILILVPLSTQPLVSCLLDGPPAGLQVATLMRSTQRFGRSISSHWFPQLNHLCRCLVVWVYAAGGNPDAVNAAFREKYKQPEEGEDSEAAAAAAKPRKCSFVELLIAEKADVSGVADVTLGTSWLHEVVR
jgi:hypothetical protein